MSNEPDLTRMSLKDMKALATAIDAAVDAGGALSVSGLEPTFVVCPGQEVVIRIGFVMPGVGRGLWLADNPPVTGIAPRSLFPSVAPVQTPPQVEVVAERPAAQDVAAPVAVGHPDPLPEAAPDEEGDTATAAEPVPVPEDGDATGGDLGEAAGGPIADPEPPEPAAPVPGSASALVASTQGAAWTEGEDREAVAIYVSFIREGQNKTFASMRVAEALKRPLPGTQFRLRHKLAAAIEAALAAQPAPANPPPAPMQPVSVELPAGGVVEGATGGAVPELVPATVAAHLDGLVPDAAWTLQMDHDLLHFAILGWPQHEIALELQVDSRAIGPRFAKLTAGKRFRRDEVLAELARRLQAAS